MEFKVGDTVVYPHHGAAVIEGMEKRKVGDEELDFLVLQIHQSDLTVKVPAKNAELVGVPTIVVVGKGFADGSVEIKDRRSGDRREVGVEDVVAEVVREVRS